MRNEGRGGTWSEGGFGDAEEGAEEEHGEPVCGKSFYSRRRRVSVLLRKLNRKLTHACDKSPSNAMLGLVNAVSGVLE